jgi:hypothetical protein
MGARLVQQEGHEEGIRSAASAEQYTPARCTCRCLGRLGMLALSVFGLSLTLLKPHQPVTALQAFQIAILVGTAVFGFLVVIVTRLLGILEGHTAQTDRLVRIMEKITGADLDNDETG